VVLKDSGCGDGHLGDSGLFSEMSVLPESDTRNALKVMVRALRLPTLYGLRRQHTAQALCLLQQPAALHARARSLNVR